MREPLNTGRIAVSRSLSPAQVARWDQAVLRIRERGYGEEYDRVMGSYREQAGSGIAVTDLTW